MKARKTCWCFGKWEGDLGMGRTRHSVCMHEIVKQNSKSISYSPQATSPIIYVYVFMCLTVSFQIQTIEGMHGVCLLLHLKQSILSVYIIEQMNQ